MIPDERAWQYHWSHVLAANALRNLARDVEKTTPRSDWIVNAIRDLADDVETHG